jgi:hypothetical protein
MDDSYPAWYTEVFRQFNTLLHKALLVQGDIGQVSIHLESLAQVDPGPILHGR